MSTQADEEKLFDFANTKQKKEERKLLQAAQKIRDVSKSERDHLEAQNREISKQLGNLRFKVRDAEEELAAKRRQMQKMRVEAERVQTDVVKARQDTAQSVIVAQEALEKIRFEEDKSLKEAQRKQREAARRELVNAMSPLGTAGTMEKNSTVAAAIGEDKEKEKEMDQGVIDNNDDEDQQQQQQQQDNANKVSTSSGVSPPRKLPPVPSTSPSAPKHQQQSSTNAASSSSAPQNYQQFLQSTRNVQQQQQQQQKGDFIASDKSHTYKMYDSTADDPRDSWYTLAPRDGASTDELFGELTRIVRTVAVEFGKPALKVLDGIPDGEDL